MKKSAVTIRIAKPSDAPEIARLVHELAVYQGESKAKTVSTKTLRKQMASKKPPFECLLAESEGKVVGYALFYQTYSTWQGKAGMNLHDIFVQDSVRGSGVGMKLMHALGEICRKRGYGRMEWHVLKENKPAIKFYRSLGARYLDEWDAYWLEGEALKKL